ncbi:MAG: RNA-binding protein [Pseudomonadota bacterium]
MTRGGRSKSRDGPERRCLATGQSGQTARLIRFALGPGGEVVPDLAGKLPGRGVWLTAERALVEKAETKRLFSRGFKAQAKAPEGLADLLEGLLVERLVQVISLARKAGQAVTGFEKVKAALDAGQVGLLLQASDGAEDGQRKLAMRADGVPRMGVLTGQELGLAFGRGFAIHAALSVGGAGKGFCARAMAEAERLAGFRPREDRLAAEPAPAVSDR